MAAQHKWKVAIIMAHDGETYFEYSDLEQSILNQPHFDNLSYAIFYYNQKYQKYSIKEVKREEKRKYLKELEVTREYNGDDTHEKLDFYDKKTIIKFLQENVSSHDTENIIHYLVITWGHGGGLFYFPPETIDRVKETLSAFTFTEDKSLAAITEQIVENINNYALFKASASLQRSEIPYPFVNKEMFSEKNLENRAFLEQLDAINKGIEKDLILYTAFQLNEIFSAGLPKEIDVYFAMNCYTQMLETGFELRKSVKMMVAPQTTIPFAGINYTALFNLLGTNPGMELRDIAENITVNFDDKYFANPFKNDFKSRYPVFPLSSVSISCNLLKEYDAFIGYLNELADILECLFNTGNTEQNIISISKARFNCRDLTTDGVSCIIDITNFFNQLDVFLPGSKYPSFINLKEKYLAQREKTIVSIKLAGPHSYPMLSSAGQIKKYRSPLFMSIFAPAVMSTIPTQRLLGMYRNVPSEFHILSRWDDFMEIFYRTIDEPASNNPLASSSYFSSPQ